MFRWAQPAQSLEESEVDHGLKMLMYDGMCSQTMGVFTGGAFLVAFALLLGASNRTIGLFAAIGPFTQILQIPSIFLVDRLRRRKLLVVVASFLGRLAWVSVALLPWIAPPESRIPLLIGSLALFFGLSAISGCAFNSWMRDLIPEKTMGTYFAKRMAISIALGAILSLLAGFGIDQAKRIMPEAMGYTILFLLGTGAGILGSWFLARIPEPLMDHSAEDKGLIRTLVQPFRDTNYRRLLFFLAAWNFAVNLAGPFFVVYMLKRLGLSMTWVLGLAVVSQLINVAFLRIWGKLADRFTNKSVLAVSGPLFMISILLWVFTTMPDRYFLTIPLLFLIHALGGMSTAGVGLCAGNIAMKAAPRGEATSYLATNSLVSGMAATVAPILGGFLADWFSPKELRLTLSWLNEAVTTQPWTMPAFSLKGLDFLFMGSFVFGLYAMHRLLGVREEGEVEERVVMDSLYTEVRRSVRHVSNMAGLRYLTYFPYLVLRSVAGEGPPEQEEPRSDTEPAGDEYGPPIGPSE
ncbi:MAG: MFS transporter [Phycisphaerae bacterium]